MRGLINIQNNENKYFRQCLVIYNPVAKNKAKLRNVNRELEKQLNFENLKIPVPKKRLCKILNFFENLLNAGFVKKHLEKVMSK